MPICQLKTNYPMDAAAREALLLDTATTAAELLNKPLAAVMAMLDSCDMRMNGTGDTVFLRNSAMCCPRNVPRKSKRFWIVLRIGCLPCSGSIQAWILTGSTCSLQKWHGKVPGNIPERTDAQ